MRKGQSAEIDSDLLAIINARTVNEMVKNTEVKELNYKEKQEENTILDNVDELMDLL